MKSKESSLESLNSGKVTGKNGKVTGQSGGTGTNPIVLAFRIEKIEAELKKSSNLNSDIMEM